MTMQEPYALHSPAPAPSFAREAARELGETILMIGTEVKGLYSVFLRTLYFCVYGRWRKADVVRQMFEIGNRSIFFLSVAMGCTSMILIYQSGLQAARLIPDYDRIGSFFLKLMVKDLGATLGAGILATRVSAGIAAEIGSMVVTEQVDALRMCAADPIDFLVVPRFLASLFMTFALVLWGSAVMVVMGFLTAHLAFDVPWHAFFELEQITMGDLVTGLVKSVAYGAAIPVVSCHCGLSTFGGSEGVGSATTRSIVVGTLVLTFLDFLISLSGLLIFND